MDDQQVTVNNLVDSHNLVQTAYDKKSYMAHIKGYMKRILDHLKENNPDRVASFQKEASAFVKDKVLAKFDEFEFYTGEQVLSTAPGGRNTQFFSISNHPLVRWILRLWLL